MIAGIDEVGRGCLAGPVVAASVILKNPIQGIKDSKKLSPKRREQLSFEIMEKSIFGIGIATNQEIDEMNILQASLLAMRRSLENLDIKPKKVLVDGMHIFKTSIEIEPIVGGDNLVPSISAASIIAKVYRDKLMTEYSKEFPNFGFQKHKLGNQSLIFLKPKLARQNSGTMITIVGKKQMKTNNIKRATNTETNLHRQTSTTSLV